MSSYALWNNKGGVGKSFLTFALATEYALAYPAVNVCVIDMCPQANSSEILLGGNGQGYTLLNQILTSSDRKTVGGYFDQRLSQPDVRIQDEHLYLSSTSNSLPNNLYVVVGDPSLELQVQSINQIASVDLPKNRWKNVHLWISDLKTGICEKYGNVTFFIDCNPSFATHTAQAIIASDKLIVPCTADGSSARAIDNIGSILYGKGISSQYDSVSFNNKTTHFQLQLPNIETILLNRYTTSSRNPSKAFDAMYKEIKKRAKAINVQDFTELPDAHAVAIVCSEKALPISKVTAGKHFLQNGEANILDTSLKQYQKKIRKLVNRLPSP